MSGFQQSASDQGGERRSFGLSDLPTLRDARGEPVAAPAPGPDAADGPAADNGDGARSEKATPAPSFAPPRATPTEPPGATPPPAIEPPRTLSFRVPSILDEPDAGPRRSEPIVAAASAPAEVAPAAPAPAEPTPDAPASAASTSTEPAPADPAAAAVERAIAEPAASAPVAQSEPSGAAATSPAAPAPGPVDETLVAEIAEPVGPAGSERPSLTTVAPADASEPVVPDVDPAALRSLLDQAGRMMEQLQTGIEEARTTTDEPGRLASDLQERLRVGARMLTAFETQIERVEELIREADDRAEATKAFEDAKQSAVDAVIETRKAEAGRVKKELAAALDAARTAIDERARRRERPAVEVEQIVAEVERHVAEAMRRIDGHVADRMPELPSQESIDLRVERSVQAATSRFDRHAAQVRSELETQTQAAGELRGRVASTVERIDAAEIKADELAARVDETARGMKSEVEEARAIARRCLDVRSGLAAELRKVVSGMEDVAGRGERMRIDVEEQLDRFEQLRDQVTDSLSNLEGVVRRVDRVEHTVDRLERLADRLAPWEELLCTSELTPDGLPRPAAELVDRLQGGLSRDVESLSQTMQEMAERMSGLGGGRRPGAVPAAGAAGTASARGGKPAQTTEVRPGGLDLPIPGRPDRSEVLSAIEDDKRRTTPRAGSPEVDADAARIHRRHAGTG